MENINKTIVDQHSIQIMMVILYHIWRKIYLPRILRTFVPTNFSIVLLYLYSEHSVPVQTRRFIPLKWLCLSVSIDQITQYTVHSTYSLNMNYFTPSTVSPLTDCLTLFCMFLRCGVRSGCNEMNQRYLRPANIPPSGSKRGTK